MRRAGCLLAALLALTLLAATPASAAYQQVGNFAGNPGELHGSGGPWPEKVQLGGVGGMAVNYTGAGGVPAGTIYAVTRIIDFRGVMVARYNPDGSFSEAWQVLGEEAEYERCGPDGDPAHPHCAARPPVGPLSLDVDVDQATGDVYVLKGRTTPIGETSQPGTIELEVFSADGSEVITRFGEYAGSGKTIAESPGKLHSALGVSPIAVNAAGEVYVFDYDGSARRLMVFKPKTPGDYTEYEYAGQGRDIGTGGGEFALHPVADAAGDIYTTDESSVAKYEPAKSATPVCSFAFKKGGITMLTVNPKTGEVFFYSYVDRKLHRLNPCVEGKFSEAEAVAISPARNNLDAMAVDPDRVFETGRAAGVLYLGAATAEGGATDGNGGGESSMGYIFAPPKELPATVSAESVSAVTSSSARLEGKVNPQGTPARYRFQYLTEAAYEANEPGDRFAGASEAPLGGGRLEGSAALPVGDAISGLVPDTAYRYRLVATSFCSSIDLEEVCVGEGPAQTFRTYPLEASGLADNRAWELVSPAGKSGGQVLPAEPETSSCGERECKPGAAYNHFPMQSSPDGEAITYEGSPFSFDEGAVIENQYIAHRGATGWQSTNLTPSRMISKGGGGFEAFDPTLGHALLMQQYISLSPQGPGEYTNIYRQPSADPLALDPLLLEAPPNRPPGNVPGSFDLFYAGASADLSRVFFRANDALTPEAPGGPEAKNNLYEFAAGELHLVNVGPGEEVVSGAGFGDGQSNLGHAISTDGSRVFWSAPGGQVYLREEGLPSRAIATEGVPDPGKFAAAAADGSAVLLDNGHLHGLGDEEPTVDLTQGKGGFKGVVGQSEDLSRIYFVDTAVLSGEEENAQGAKALAGKENLYAWQGGTVAFIATLVPGDNPNSAGDWAASPAQRTAEASPDGRWLTFISKAPLSGYANVGPCGVQINAEKEEEVFDTACAEVFLYDAATGDLRCPSCNPTGAPPLGNSTLRRIARGLKSSLPQPRYLLDSGRLYFDSQDSLSPFDTNKGVEDVYEFEPSALGSCGRPAGCVSLISSGHSGIDSNFLAIDQSAKNVFFTSRDQLVAADEDDLVDLYDAREGGGFAPAVGSAECQGEACLPSVSPPNDPTPSSAGFKGPGNQTAGRASGRCPKGRHAVKRKGKSRCVKSQAKRHHKRHDNRGGAK